MRYLGRLLLIVVLDMMLGSASAQAISEASELAAIYGDADFVSLATGNSQPISRAPAVASVITADQIREMGAADLDQVLESVPGLHVSYFYQMYNPIYTMRGIYSDTNPQILMLINGIATTNLYQSNRGQIWGGMPVNNIARIEVIRGPGSALYGADAYAGIINIVTKDAAGINGTEAGGRLGSFDSKDVWLLHGKNYGGFDISYALEVGETDGQDETIEIDLLKNSLDPASLAPGPVNLGRKYLETRLGLSRDNWQMRVGYQGRFDVETGAGVAQALDPAGSNDSNRFNADISYHMSDPEYWDSTFQLSYFDTSAKSDLVLYPPGAFGGAFPDGVIGNPDVYERHTRFSASTFYTGWEQHRLRFGAGINYGDLYKVKESRNFAFGPGGLVPLGGTVDVSDTAPFVREENRTNTYVFVQDEWSFARDWDITAGVRYDHYSDFGETINPRIALVWQSAYNLTSKILYGRAFRAPSFSELYNINNPVALGNANLEPETIDTLELAFDYQTTANIRTGLNLFYYEMQDIIRFLPDPAPATTVTAQNSGDQNGYGLEWELNWLISRTLTLNMNYAYQRAEDDATNTDAGNAPRQQLYSRLDWKLAEGWSLHGQANHIGKRRRVAGDARPALDDYTTVDATLRHSLTSKLEAAASVHNIFDEDAREPSSAPGLIPNDLPLAGRSIFGELRYQF